MTNKHNLLDDSRTVRKVFVSTALSYVVLDYVFRVWSAFPCVSLRVWCAGVVPHVLPDAGGHA